MALREELRQALDMASSSSEVVTLDQSRVGRLSRMDAMQQQQMSQASRTAYRGRLQAVEQALALLSSGEYGWCEQCGEPVDLRRLEVKPESTLCLGCQQQSETRG